MKIFYFKKITYSVDAENDPDTTEYTSKYADQVWYLYWLQNVLIILSITALAFAFYDISNKNKIYWFQRSGSILVAFSAYVEICCLSPRISRAGEQLGSWVFEFTAHLHQWAFIALATGSIMWGYGDLVVKFFRI